MKKYVMNVNRNVIIYIRLRKLYHKYKIKVQNI